MENADFKIFNGKEESIPHNEITINKKKIKENFEKTRKFFLDKRVQWIIVGLVLLLILFVGTGIRTSNLELLKDQTTGEYIPIALDPFYFLRVAETMLENNGLPAYDFMRKPMDFPWTPELLSNYFVWQYKIANLFGDYSLQYMAVLNPVVFFILGLVAFYFLALVLLKSKTAALISSAFLAVIPAYLYRTMAGFADHEAPGMFFLFLTFISLAYLLNKLESGKLKDKRYFIWIASILLGVLTTVTLVSWGGGSNYIFMSVPLAFLLFWILKSGDFENRKHQIIISYVVWLFSAVIFAEFTRYGMGSMFNRISGGFLGILIGFVLLFMISSFVIDKASKKYHHKLLRKNNLVSSFVLTIILGIIAMFLMGMSPVETIGSLIERVVTPFGSGRVGLTVAENKQPYLNELISQMGKNFFWIFFAGTVFIGFRISRGIKSRKHKIGFSLAWIYFIAGLILSRISPEHIFNGDNFLSKIFFFSAWGVIGVYSLYILIKKEVEIDLENSTLVMIAVLLPMLISIRGAIRLFFVVAPFLCLMAGNAFVFFGRQIKLSKNKNSRMIFALGLILILILGLISFSAFYKSTSLQAKSTGPSAHVQWQKAMQWVRENTSQESVFAHWWDYGYWVQYLGERPTIADGGHFQGSFRDHLIGRYILTTPDPDTAMSFMKSNNVSYLLIDQTDLGKYGAYSSIGSDETGNDRRSYIPIMVNDPVQMQETANSTLMVYVGGANLDGDVIYDDNGTQAFLPEGSAGIGGIVVELKREGNSVDFGPPTGVYIYNGQQYRLPIKKIFFNGQLADFGSGVEATLMILPAVEGQNINNMGAMIYLSEKTQNSLFAQLYLMDDPQNLYETFELGHSEPDTLITSIKSQGAPLNGEFIYYQGFRGPIKIWKTDYPEDILEKEEFLRTNGEYAEFDDLEFRK